TGRIPTSCLKKYSLNRVSNFMGSLHGLKIFLGCVLFEMLLLLFFITPLGQVLNYGIEGGF
ncbi:hypothetical protein NSA02_11255, partial [Ligilactobacillus murinus]|uniref:hypothetical protein n=1 Tax=Ligilactobacillus murinus TaxID=1622 RepID=UPI00214ADAC2